MKKWLFLGFMVILTSSSFARKPAVEDFMGVEPDQEYKVPTDSMKTTFNFSQNKSAFNKVEPISNGSDWTAILVTFVFILLPVISFSLLSKKSKQSESEVAANKEATLNNVKVFADYQKNDSDDDDVKKVS